MMDHLHVKFHIKRARLSKNVKKLVRSPTNSLCFYSLSKSFFFWGGGGLENRKLFIIFLKSNNIIKALIYQ